MERTENGIVTQFEKFAWDSDKAKLAVKLPLKATENPLLLYIEFGKNSERSCFGEEKAVRQIADEQDCISKHKGAVLMMSEERPLGSLLMDSFTFITDNLSKVKTNFALCFTQSTAATAIKLPTIKCWRSYGAKATPFSGSSLTTFL